MDSYPVSRASTLPPAFRCIAITAAGRLSQEWVASLIESTRGQQRSFGRLPTFWRHDAQLQVSVWTYLLPFLAQEPPLNITTRTGTFTFETWSEFVFVTQAGQLAVSVACVKRALVSERRRREGAEEGMLTQRRNPPLITVDGWRLCAGIAHGSATLRPLTLSWSM